MSEFVLSTSLTITPEVATPEVQAQPVSVVPRYKRMLTAVSAVLAIGGCTAEDKPEAVDYTSPVHANITQGVNQDSFKTALAVVNPDLQVARAMIPGLATDSVEITDAMNYAIDTVVAKKIIDGQHSSSASDTKDAIASITSPRLKADTTTAVFVIQAGRLVKKAILPGFSAVEAHNNLDVLAPSDMEDATKASAHKALDVAHASDIIGDYSLMNGNEDIARLNIATIDDLEVQGFGQTAIDAHDARKLLEDLWQERITAAEAREDAANIVDDGIRKRTLAAISAGQYDPNSLYDFVYGLESEAKSLEEHVKGLDDEFDEALSSANNMTNTLLAERFDALAKVDEAVGNRIAVSHNLRPQKLETLQVLQNPRETVNLEGVEGLQIISNACRNVVIGAEAEKCGPETYAQFGEVFVQDGKLTVFFQEGGGLTEKVKSQMLIAVEYNRPYLEAAFASGELVSMHLIVGDSFSPEFLLPTREVYMIMPQDNTMSMDQLTKIMSHELKHALTRNFFSEVKVTKEELRRLDIACDNLRRTAYKDFRDTLWIRPELLGDLKKAAKLEHEPIIDTLIEAVDKSVLSDVAGLDRNYPSADAHFNECFKVRASAGDIILNAIPESGVSIKLDDLQYLYKTEAYAAFAQAWVQLIDYRSVYEDLIDESNYVQTSAPDKEELGHSEEKAAEAYGSVLTSAIDYEELFVAGLQKLKPEERNAVIDLLDLALQEFAKHPSLKEYAEDLRAKYAALR